MKTIVEILPLANGAHRNQTGEFSEIPAGWIEVYTSLQEVYATAAPFFDLEIENGVLVGIVARDKPELPDPQPSEPTAEEKLRADVDYLAALQGVAL